MLNDFRTCFTEEYRFAHDEEKINSANPEKLAVCITLLCSELKKSVNCVTDIPDKINDKFTLFSELLAYSLKIKDLQNKKAAHLQISICLGSILEGTLQLFLLAYNREFINAHWKQWSETDMSALRTGIQSYLADLVQKKTINKDQKESISKLLKTEFEVRENGKEIDIIMLDELIGFCRNQKIFSYDEKSKAIYSQMDSIRDARNNIHIFTKKDIPSFTETILNVRNYCIIILDLITRIDGLSTEE